MSDAGISDILLHARANNIRYGLTGALLYHGGRFIQILEGPDEELRARFNIISADPRHSRISKISEEAIEARQFPDWTMGFRPLSDAATAELAKYDNYFDGRAETSRLSMADEEGQRLLAWLAQYWFLPD